VSHDLGLEIAMAPVRVLLGASISESDPLLRRDIAGLSIQPAETARDMAYLTRTIRTLHVITHLVLDANGKAFERACHCGARLIAN
jgi:hypothetical protein